MSHDAPMRPFAVMEAGARQIIMMMGLGFLGLVAGSMLTASLLSRLNDRLEGDPSFAAQLVFALVLPNLWALVVLPALAWLTLRFLELKPLSFAVVSVGTAFAFRSALDFVTLGSDFILSDPLQVGARLGVLAAGVTLTWLAGRRGQAWAQAQAALAAQQAQKTKEQYSQFAEQARALAEKREAQPISAAADPTASSGPGAPPPGGEEPK